LHFFGVFDGHSGARCAEYSSHKLPVFIDEKKEITPETIEQATMELDQHFLQQFPEIDDGCTATFSIVENIKNEDKESFKIYVGNVGDSRTFLIKQDGQFEVTKDHKPNDQKEKDRIIAAKGSVLMNRVNGDLALSRALGDRKFKANPDLTPEKQQVSPQPDVTVYTATKDDFLLICCDGIFEAMGNNEVVDFVRSRIGTTEDLTSILSELLNQVIVTSKDNTTAMIIQFKDGTSYQSNNKDEFIISPLSKEDKGDYKRAYEENLLRHGFTLEQSFKAENGILLFSPENITRVEMDSGLKKCSSTSCIKVESQLGEYKTCAKCKAVFYCSKECQAFHWKLSHKIECKSIESK